ncbi:hypothetical protein K8I28_11450 [bacterium]|nr:hypothetical protein [bacterium]
MISVTGADDTYSSTIVINAEAGGLARQTVSFNEGPVLVNHYFETEERANQNETDTAAESLANAISRI